VLKFLLCLLFITNTAFAKVISFPLNSPREYDFKDKDHIFSVRKKMLKKYPVFFSGNYEPNSSVFSQIVEGKPWWGLQGIECKGPGKKAIDGASEESRFIDNPFLLIGVDQAYAAAPNEKAHCSDDYPRPSNLKLNTDKKHFSVNYKVKKIAYRFVGRNALDFGVKYVYADKVKGIKFNNNQNVSTDVYVFKDFIHLGNSCGYPGGCNNGSPAQPELDFSIPNGSGSIHFKLWKTKPKSKDDKADMTYEISFR
jgi:hypothetical protein